MPVHPSKTFRASSQFREWMRPWRILACALALNAGACSDMGLPTTALSTGSLTPQESHLDCAQLARIINTEIGRLKFLPTVAFNQQNETPSTLTAAWSRMTGPAGADLPALRDYTQARARLKALGAQHSTNCRPTIDIDGELAATDSIMTSGAWAQATPAEARSMLDKAAAGLKSNRDQTLPQLRAGGSGYRDRDLYVLCARVTDGTILADVLGKAANARDLKDAHGKDYGVELMTTAVEGRVSEITYTVQSISGPPKPRTLLATRVGDMACGVSHVQ